MPRIALRVAAMLLAAGAAEMAAAASDRHGEPSALAFRPGSGDMILVLDESERPRLFDLADPAKPKLVATLPEASAAAFLARDRIVTGHADGMIRRWTLDGKPAGAP